jgi:monoamine oxidase
VHDVVVVGAGLAGLSAADRLAKDGRSVLVFEAADEAGGRARSRRLPDGTVVDLGGEFIGPGHRLMAGLVRELGLHREPTQLLGRPILWRDAEAGRRARLPAARPWAVLRALARLGRLGRRLDPVAPWKSAGAAALDRVTLGGWLRDEGIDGAAYAHLSAVFESLASAPVEELSLLHPVWWLRRGGGPLGALHTTFAWRVAEGAQEVARRLALRIGTDRVRTGAVVSALEQRRDAVVVHLAAGGEVVASRVVVAVPATRLADLTFDPPLDAELGALGRLRIDAGTKVVARLPDGCRPRHAAVIGGDDVVVAWRRGDVVTGFRPDHESRRTHDRLLADLAAAFGAEAGQLRDVTTLSWDEQPYAGGCDVGFRPSQITSLGPHLGRAHGRVHFAGSERSSWPNNMEGAVESGRRAADEIIAAA